MAVRVVDPAHPDPTVIAEAAALIRDGALVAFPTETVYGLGANALDADAVARIYAAKGRPAWNPVILHVASIAGARELAASWPDAADRLARHFWPGPLTLVLPRRASVPAIVAAGGDTVGLRWPDHPVAAALIATAGVPVAAPSANRFTELSPTTAAHVVQSLGDRVPLILDGGPSTVGIESTVVDLTTPTPRLLRPGAISTAALGEVLGVEVVSARDPAVAAGAAEPAQIPRAPGQADRHYAPRTPVWLFDPEEAIEVAARARASAGRARIAALLLTASPPLPDDAVVVRTPEEPAAYAQRLYAVLHELDAAGCALILIERPPAAPPWEAVRDRLQRADAPTR